MGMGEGVCDRRVYTVGQVWKKSHEVRRWEGIIKGGNREKEMDGGKRSRKYGKGEKETTR